MRKKILLVSVAAVALSVFTVAGLALASNLAPADGQDKEPGQEQRAGGPMVDKAIADLAARLGIGAEHIALKQVEDELWSNACLGIEDPDVMCAEVITPGYRITLEAEGTTYTYHTDAEAHVVLAQQTQAE
jgi:hypothetical protein